MPWGRVPKHTFNDICRGFCVSSFAKLFFFWQDLFRSSFLQFCSQELEQVFVDIVHIDMLGWTGVDWAGHWSVSLDGHIWSHCTMSTAHQIAEFQQLYFHLASFFLAFCKRTLSDSVWPVQISEAVDFFGGTFPAKTSICKALRVRSNFGHQLALQNFTHTFYRRLCAARNIPHVGKCKRRCGSVTSRLLASAREHCFDKNAEKRTLWPSPPPPPHPLYPPLQNTTGSGRKETTTHN